MPQDRVSFWSGLGSTHFLARVPRVVSGSGNGIPREVQIANCHPMRRAFRQYLAATMNSMTYGGLH